MQDEKRRARRFELSLPVTVVAAGWKMPPMAVQTLDISSNGVLLEFSQDMSPGTTMEMEITLPAEITRAGPVRVRCLGHVVRVDRSARTGIAVTIERYEFLRLKDAGPKPRFLQ